MNWDDLLTPQRLVPDQTSSALGRSEFQKDHDRIVFSHEFRRLQGKTQVHPLPGNDHVHNRLTHTLEVASVGRSLGEGVGHFLKKEKKLPATLVPTDVGAIVQAACLAHDLGSPPFGHAGEFAIREWFSRRNQQHLKDLDEATLRDFENFEANAQGFRIIVKLASHLGCGGLHLTAATMSAFHKYPWSSKQDVMHKRAKFGFFDSEAEEFKAVCEKVGIDMHRDGSARRHPLAHLVEAADDICYGVVDIEDGVELGLVHPKDAEKLLSTVCDNETLASFKTTKSLPPRQRLGWLRGKALGIMIDRVVDTFRENEADIIKGKLTSDIIQLCCPKVSRTVKKAKQMARDQIFIAQEKTRIELGAYAVMDILLSAVTEAAVEMSKKADGDISFRAQRVRDLMGPDAPTKGASLSSAIRKAVDYVAGMTDVFAGQLAGRLGGHII